VKVQNVGSPFLFHPNIMYRNGLLGRVTSGAVVFRQVRHHHLSVAFGAQGSTLQQWLAVKQAPLVHVPEELKTTRSKIK